MDNSVMPMTIAVTLLLVFGPLTRSGYAEGDPHAVKVAVAYADNLHNQNPVPPAKLKPLPSPWAGSPGVIFIGTASPGPWDAGAIKLENPSNQPLTVDSVTVDIDSAKGINPWAGATPFVIPRKGTAILTQTSPSGSYNFDTSDGCSPTNPTCTSASGTYTATTNCSSPNSVTPVVHVTVGAGSPVTKDFIDQDQVLNTGGVDASFCPPDKNESHDWEVVHEGDASEKGGKHEGHGSDD